VSSNITGRWSKVAVDLTKDTVEPLDKIGRDVDAEEKDALGLTREAPESEEEGLRDFARRLGAAKREVMALNRELMVS
jgi:hypothetical protein